MWRWLWVLFRQTVLRATWGGLYSTREGEDKLVEAIRHENKEQQDVESEPLLRPQDPKQVEMGVTSDVSG